MRIPSEYGPSLLVLVAAGTVLLGGPLMVQELGFRSDLKRVELAGARLEVEGGVLDQMNQAFRDLAVAVEPSVVHIASRQRKSNGASSLSTGSGWIYDTDGHIVTNHHVVDGSEAIEVQLADGRLREAELVGSDPLTDIAVLRIDPARTIPARRADANEQVEQGDLVFAFGSPFDFRFSMSQGVVSGRDRYAGVIETQARRGLENFIQVDAAINPGNSGGPLTDYRGRVIGMNTAIATSGNRGGTGESGRFAGIGLAIPLEMIEPVVGQIISKGFAEQGFLGVRMLDLVGPDRVTYGLERNAVIVIGVESDTAAEAAGLQDGDIIVSVDGNRVPGRRQLIARIGSSPPGSDLQLGVLRPDDQDPTSHEALDLSVTLGRVDVLEIYGRLPPSQSRERITALGIESMRTASAEDSEAAGLPPIPGVIIDDWVDSDPDVDSRYLRMGWRTPVLVVRCNGMPVSDVDSFIDALNRSQLYPERRGAATEIIVLGRDGGPARESVIWFKDRRRSQRP